MSQILPSEAIVRAIAASENDYMFDRMTAIQARPGNPEGVEIGRFGSALCLYSATMPWPSFNTVKGFTSENLPFLDDILAFYTSKARNAQFEMVPGLVDGPSLHALAERGFYQSGYHASLYREPSLDLMIDNGEIVVKELEEDEFELYAMLHCRGTGLPDNGIPHVAANNKVLYHRPGWKFLVAYLNGIPAATAVMYQNNGAASLTFAATLPEHRGQGLQTALIQRRVVEAAKANSKIVVGQCSFLSQSHRNMERAGMRIGYIRTTWTAGQGRS
ncbi:GNAT family N-acetyltransferase [Paenibacillus sambharensis]|uniref:GNAT family N-acetyltransferase n=1 Tax=Paenibacillus sambharensis TaxID=1803190 RepID=A0A2W1M052_9BACL|nr:GNAT family N-acetyltransferase [Paenibacillus sambharensis]PZD97321.1 GNAT family N-acetyltransferase [Paenibacillus sambharensis]